MEIRDLKNIAPDSTAEQEHKEDKNTIVLNTFIILNK
jgi:hypothetical protein